MWKLAVVMLAGCGAAPSARPLAPTTRPASPTMVEPPSAPVDDATATPAIDWTRVQVNSDADALALWQRMALTGLDWDRQVAEIPDDAALIQALALAQLRAATLACPSQGHATGCADDPGVFELAPTATWANPCLQRELALWSVAQLEDPDLLAEEALLVRLVSVPGDNDLASAVLTGLDGASTVQRVRLITAAVAAGNIDGAITGLPPLPPDELARLGTTLHLDAAFALFAPQQMPGPFIAAINDELLRPATRMTIIDDLVDDALRDEADRIDAGSVPPAATDTAEAAARWRRMRTSPLGVALVLAVRQADGRVAGHAITALRELGQAAPWKLLPRPRTTTEALRQLIMRATIGVTLAPLLARTVEVVEHLRVPVDAASASDNSDSDGHPEYVTTRARQGADLLTELPFADEVAAPTTRCGQGRCTASDGTVIGFRWGRGPALTAIERTDPGACGVPVPWP